MSTFPIRNDEYSVEEISYDDMMSILSSQKPIPSDESNAFVDKDTASLNKPVLKRDEFSKRIAENAKQKLPDWLLNS